jgi:hypothetical protein
MSHQLVSPQSEFVLYLAYWHAAFCSCGLKEPAYDLQHLGRPVARHRRPDRVQDAAGERPFCAFSKERTGLA